MNKYQSYKPSDVEWIGEIPEGWRVSKFKYVSKLYTGNSLNDEQKVLYESDDENHIPYVSSKDIDLNTLNVNYNNGLRIPKENNLLKVSPKDSFLLCVEGGSSGRKMVYLDREVCFVNKLCSFKSIENTRFQYYFIQSSNFQDKFRLSLSGLIGGVSISTLRDFELVLPSINEQHQIVEFLDEKTELINKLISSKERKITLLKEQRTSIINQIVTKGLNPKEKMKDSGVDWIGEIPEHWITKKMKFLVQICNGSDFKDFTLEEGGFPVYGSGGEFSRSSKFIYDKISVLLGRKGSIDKPKIVDEPFWCSDTTYYTKIKNGVNPYFFYYLVQQINFERYVYGSTIPSMTKSVYDEMVFPYPLINEQNQIVEFLDSKTKEIDELVDLEQKKIDLLKEYRQSLISEVVTGKINVSNKN